MYNADDLENVTRLHANGLGVRRIAEATGISRSTVAKMLNGHWSAHERRQQRREPSLGRRGKRSWCPACRAYVFPIDGKCHLCVTRGLEGGVESRDF